MIEIKRIDEVLQTKKKFITLFGKGGSGKTTFAVNNYLNKLLITIDDDGGLETIRKLSPEVKNTLSVIKTDVPPNMSPIGFIANQLLEIKQTDYSIYDCIIFDPVSEIRNRQAAFIKQTENQGANLKINQWGEIGDMMNNLIELIQSLTDKTNVIVILHEDIKETEDTITGNKYYKVSTPIGDKANGKLERISDEIIRVTKNGDQVLFDFGSNQNTICKSRRFGHETLEQLIKANLTLDQIIN